MKLFSVMRLDKEKNEDGYTSAMVVAESRERVIPVLKAGYPEEFSKLWGDYKHLLVNEIPMGRETVVDDHYND